ncbi:recombinase family protein [Streptomyces sp. MBT56]|uniref:recombinase family protein n=1 Tax=unclassified Streptomyces TaxID=2593676 RepID=UPI00190C3C9D|nr:MULTISPECIES: recombinase family protein [unclassified Streptomyces]MBK3559760.1 recombinase family protein [Streptomyces sp. MBT56]MBK3601298.1 recombinase family protein [Streptomyces sp. MBT54]MBK3615255.1 recombinase family protein [Streptomyces sp. MBT98]
MQSQSNILERARRGDLTGLKIAGLVRLSFEVNPNKERPDVPLTGSDINNREEQEQLCRDYVEARGGIYIGTYDEPHTSAWKKKRITLPDGTYAYRVVRPVFEGMLSDLKKGITETKHFTPVNGFNPRTEIDGSIVYDVDRLTRDNRHLEDAIETVEYHHRPIIDITGTLDLLTENGRDMARVMVTMAGKQSAATSRRVKNIHRAMAREGIPVGGTRPFGWQDDKRTADAKEKKLINDAATDLLEGKFVHTILREWEKSGVLTPKGNFWVRQTFLNMITSPRLVGWRVYGPVELPLHERYARDKEGNPIKGQHEALLDEKTWRAVVDLLKDPERPGAGVYVGKLKYMCSGHLRCGNCAGKMRGNADKRCGFMYICDTCHKVSGTGPTIDKLITELIFARLDKEEIPLDDTPWTGAEELAECEATKANLLAQFKGNPDMGTHIWPEIRKAEATISKLLKERATHLRKTPRPKTKNIREEWEGLDIEQKHTIVGENFEAIILHPAKKGANRFNPDRLQMIPR